MLIHVDNCPRCKAMRTTFDVLTITLVSPPTLQRAFYLLEAPLKCRNCRSISVIGCIVSDNNIVNKINAYIDRYELLSDFLTVRSFVSLADIEVSPPPEYLPLNVNNAFVEGAKCYAAGCYNAAGAMFRLSLDLASKSQLPADGSGITITPRQKNYLADRLEWLFDNNHWPASLKDMVTCIRQDGNDGAHDGELGEDEAYDIMDFSFLVLEKIYTEPERIRISQQRRASRKQQ